MFAMIMLRPNLHLFGYPTYQDSTGKYLQTQDSSIDIISTNMDFIKIVKTSGFNHQINYVSAKMKRIKRKDFFEGQNGGHSRKNQAKDSHPHGRKDLNSQGSISIIIGLKYRGAMA